jgi:DNA-binding SARP family transcriptional activator/O-acetyl-ADP-ribose deacetylase (regulator of RNase III)
VNFRILGATEIVSADGRTVRLSRRHERWVLGILLLEAGRSVPVTRIADLVWEDDPPDLYRSALRTYAARIRAKLVEAGGPAAGSLLVSAAGGYRLDVAPEAVDAGRFRALVEQAVGTVDLTARERVLRDALALWDGPALPDVPERLRRRACAHLEELRTLATETCLAAGIDLGRSRELLPELARLTAENTTDERLLELRLVALYRSGRTAEALELYTTTRDELVESLGLEPGPALRRLQQAMLRGEPVEPVSGAVRGTDPTASPSADGSPGDELTTGARLAYLHATGTTVDADLSRIVDKLLRLTPAIAARHQPRPLTETRQHTYHLPDPVPPVWRLGIITGTIRRVKGIDAWVNSENTDMVMSRFTDFSISGIIRYWGARRDADGHVTADLIADELDRAVGPNRPVAPGSAVVTGAGRLTASHGVRRVVHVAAVQGAPGAGYQPVPYIATCVRNALIALDAARSREDPIRSVLFPVLGVGVADGPLTTTARGLVDAAVEYLGTHPDTTVREVYFLGFTDVELAALELAVAAAGLVADEVDRALPGSGLQRR